MGKARIERKPCLNCNKLLKSLRSVYCSNSCQGEYRRNLKIKAWLAGEFKGLDGNNNTCKFIKKYLIKSRGHSCEVCSIAIWNSLPITLEVHHIDGDNQNNYTDNLQLICPNCHSQTQTYKAKNKGRGRKSRLV